MAEAAQDPRRTAARPGILSRIFGTAARLVMWILLSLVFSVIIEWVGMTLWWPQQGNDHSREMLVRELGYLDQEFRRSVVTSDPMQFAKQIVERTHYLLFEVTGFENFVRVGLAPTRTKRKGCPAGSASGLSAYCRLLESSSWRACEHSVTISYKTSFKHFKQPDHCGVDASMARMAHAILRRIVPCPPSRPILPPTASSA